MKSNCEKIIEFLRTRADEWFDDDALSETLDIRPRQQVNQICRSLAEAGKIVRREVNGKIRNSIIPGKTEVTPKEEQTNIEDIRVEVLDIGPDGLSSLSYGEEENLTEDELKASIEKWLRKDGFDVKVAYRGAHGPDIVARKEAEKIVIEVKGEGSRPEMRENYFLAIIGEICKRMEDPHAKYVIALPAHEDFVKKALNLPRLAKQRLNISFVLGRRIERGIYHLYLLKERYL